MNFVYISYRKPKGIIKMRDLLYAAYAFMAQKRRVQYASDLDVLHNTANEKSVLIAFRMLSLLSAKGTKQKRYKKLVRKDDAKSIFGTKFIRRRISSAHDQMVISDLLPIGDERSGITCAAAKRCRSSLSSVSEFGCINSIGKCLKKRRCSIMSKGSYQTPMRQYFPIIKRDSSKSRTKYRAWCRNICSLIKKIQSIELYKLHTLRQILMERCGSIFHQSSDRAKSIVPKYSVIYGFPLI